MLAILCGLFPAGARAASHWTPPQQLTWYWQLTGKVDMSRDVDAYDLDADNFATLRTTLRELADTVTNSTTHSTTTTE